jgi:tetratricopeptide (TPR) repeat protein
LARDDWFRNADWNAEIEEAFGKRLRRARDKSQYLRIQASCLAETYPTVALCLLEQYFGLGEHFDIAQAYGDKARALIALKDCDGALASYEAALERERQYPKLKTHAYLDYPCFVAEAKLESMYARALEVLTTNRDRPMFPIDRFRAHGARALLLYHLEGEEEARADARLAMAAAQEAKSGFRYHQGVGLVRSTDDEFATRVAALAG